MKAPYLNKAHRYVGITIAPFMVIQVLSGLFLDFGLFRRGTSIPGDAAKSRAGWDIFLVKAHFGPGLLSDAYHIVLACGIVWMACSGCLLFLRIKRMQRQANTPRPKP
jgi:uncharacterized iron-regulated membrane protein